MEGNLPEARDQLQDCQEMPARLIALDNSILQSPFYIFSCFHHHPPMTKKAKDLNTSNAFQGPVVETMLSKAIKGLESLLKGSEEVSHRNVDRRSFLRAGGLATALAGMYACGCDSGGGGGGSDNTTPSDTTPPGMIQDLYAYASSQKGESVYVEFTQPGDDGFNNLPKPEYLEIRVSDASINSETEWDNAVTMAVLFEDELGGGGSYFSREFDLSQIQAVVDAGLNSGDLYFSARAYDEANNEGELSIPENPGEDHAYIPSKAEFYVDKWIDSGGDINLNYDESVLLIRGDASKGVDYNADALAQILINTDAQSGTPWSDFATWEDIRDLLLQYTDGQPVTADNSELIDASDATKLNSFMKYVCEILTYNPGSGNYEYKSQSFNDLTQPEWDAVYDIHRNALIQIVSAFSENYGNLDPSHNPDW